MLMKDTAICIRAVDYSETSQVATFLTRGAGKISAIAKGSKRPKSAFDGPIEIFSFGEIVFTSGAEEKLAVLTEFQQETAFGGLSGNMFVLNCAQFAAELVDGLTDDYDSNQPLFDSFKQFLENVSQSDSKTDVVAFLTLFQFSLLKDVGMQPVLKHCVNCRNVFKSQRREVYFSTSANGLICKDCEASFVDKIRISPAAAACLDDFKKIADANEATLGEIEKILIHHFTALFGKKPAMAKYVIGEAGKK